MRQNPVLALALVLSLSITAAGATAATKKKPTTAQKESVEKGTLKTSFETLVSAEQAFARMSVEKGIRAAFLANLSPDCVMFDPLPVNGHDLSEARPASTARLVWLPAYGEIAASGDFGITTGPWEYTPPADRPNAHVSYGQFFSVWRRQRGKEWKDWKVVLDFGISHARPSVPLAGTTAAPGPLHTMMALPPDTLPGELMRTLDRSFSSMSRTLNPSHAVVAYAAHDLRFLKDGDEPRTGDDARNALSGVPASAVWRPIDGAVARSGDLGYSYGVREDSTKAGTARDTTIYVHVWRYTPEKKWNLAVVVNKPLTRE